MTEHGSRPNPRPLSLCFFYTGDKYPVFPSFTPYLVKPGPVIRDPPLVSQTSPVVVSEEDFRCEGGPVGFLLLVSVCTYFVESQGVLVHRDVPPRHFRLSPRVCTSWNTRSGPLYGNWFSVPPLYFPTLC